MRELSRIARLFIGLVLYGLGNALSVRASIGVGPWEAFHIGISLNSGLSMGTVSIIVSFFIILITLMSGERIGVGTIANMFVIGRSLDIFLGIIPPMSSMAAGIAMILSGITCIAAAIVIYMGAGYGAGPRDGLMVMLSKLTSLPPGYCKAGVEAIVLAVGWQLGGPVGIGTIIAVLCVGPIIQIVFKLARFDVKGVKQESIADTARRCMGR